MCAHYAKVEWHMACLQVRIVVKHSEAKLTHLATRWVLPFEDSELKTPLKNAETFTYPELQVMLHTVAWRSAFVWSSQAADSDGTAEVETLAHTGASVPHVLIVCYAYSHLVI